MCPSIQKLGSQDCVTRQEVGQRRQALLVGQDSHLIVPAKPELSSWRGLGLQQWIGNSWDQIQATSSLSLGHLQLVLAACGNQLRSLENTKAWISAPGVCARRGQVRPGLSGLCGYPVRPSLHIMAWESLTRGLTAIKPVNYPSKQGAG